MSRATLACALTLAAVGTHATVAATPSAATASAVTPSAAAQATPVAVSADEPELEEVVVTGRREVGAVIGDIAPEFQLSAQEIRALGVGSVTELLAALGPQLGSSRGRGGRPVVLLNGVRISSFAEVRDLPTEAILRTDVLPEEVALKYGYRADQRVVNIVLRPRFRAFTGELAARGTTAGGREGADLAGNWLRIQREGRWQVDLKARRDQELLESERTVLGADGRINVDAAERTLAPLIEQATANLVYATPFATGQAGTVNLSIDDTRRESRLGQRPGAGGPVTLRRTVDALDVHFGGIVQGSLAGWRWSATLNADRSDARISTTGDLLGSRSRSESVDMDLVASGTPLTLPAGPLALTVKSALGARAIDGSSRRGPSLLLNELDRSQRDLQLNLDVPLWRGESGERGRNALGLNVNHALEHLSDVGTLRTSGVGLNWSLTRSFRLLASYTDEQGAPSMQQLGAAVIATPLVRSFDFVRGETVEITRIDGGNPQLAPDRREVLKISIGSRPLADLDLDLNADFVRTRSRDLISDLPAATAELERAFAARFQRDADGRLLSIDARPVNLAARDRDELRLGVNLSLPWGPQPEPPTLPGRGARPSAGAPGGNAAAGDAVAPGANGRPVGGAMPADDAARRASMAQVGERFTAFARRGSLQFSLLYTERLADQLRIAPGLPSLDLLDGDTLAESAGNPRRELELQFGGNRDGYGGRLVAQWRSGSRISTRTPGVGSGELDFAALTTVNLRLFADLGLLPVARDYPFLRGARITVAVGNLFDSHPEVRDAAGRVPINYQPDLLEPQGRNIRLVFRKVFLPSFTPAGGRAG